MLDLWWSQEQFEEYGSRAWHDQPIDRTEPLRPPVSPSKGQQAMVVSLLQYGCTTLTLLIRIEKSLDGETEKTRHFFQNFP